MKKRPFVDWLMGGACTILIPLIVLIVTVLLPICTVAHCAQLTALQTPLNCHNAGGERIGTKLCDCESGFSVGDCFECNPGRTDGNQAKQPCPHCDSGKTKGDCFECNPGRTDGNQCKKDCLCKSGKSVAYCVDCNPEKTDGNKSHKDCPCNSSITIRNCLQCTTPGAGSNMCPRCESTNNLCSCKKSDHTAPFKRGSKQAASSRAMAKAQKQNQKQTVAKAQERTHKSAGAFYTQDPTNRKRVRTKHPTLNSSECAHRHTTNLP